VRRVTTAQQALSQVLTLHRRLMRRRKDVDDLFDYFSGKHPLVYATPTWRMFHQDRYRGFADNWCGVVARAPVDRLRIDGFRLSDSTSLATPAEKQLWADWNRNEMTAQSNQGFLSTVVARRSFTLVWGDKDENPVMTWEHPGQMIVETDSSGRQILSALKVWTDDDTEFATLYLPADVWKFKRAASVTVNDGRTENGIYVPHAAQIGDGGWEPREVADEAWPLPNPYGEVPVVEWPNRPLLSGDPISDIAGVKAMQDAINLMWGYLFVAADYASMPARVVQGEPPNVPILDENGQVIGKRPAKMEDLAQGRLLFLPGAQGIGSWDAAKLDVFTDVVNEAISHIAAQTSTPGHYLLSNEKFANLNGDALTAAEVPLATKVGNQQVHLTPAAKRTLRLMALTRNDKGSAEAIVEADGAHLVQWKDPAMHSLAQVADAATKDRSIGISLRTILERRYGMTEPEIDREMERIDAERGDSADPIIDRIAAGLTGGRSGSGD